jgi:hypothetical protein
LETLEKAGHFPNDPKTGFPTGIYDLGKGRIAAMDESGIDVQILSYPTPSAEVRRKEVQQGFEPLEHVSSIRRVTHSVSRRTAATSSSFSLKVLAHCKILVRKSQLA